MSKNIAVKLGKKEYLRIDIPITANTSRILGRNIASVGGIMEGIKEIKRGGIINQGYAIMTVLIPIENIEKFNKFNLENDEVNESYDDRFVINNLILTCIVIFIGIVIVGFIFP